MAIRIINEPEISLTQADYERLHLVWQAEQQYTTAPESFEAWLRRRQLAQRRETRIDGPLGDTTLGGAAHE